METSETAWICHCGAFVEMMSSLGVHFHVSVVPKQLCGRTLGLRPSFHNPDCTKVVQRKRHDGSTINVDCLIDNYKLWEV